MPDFPHLSLRQKLDGRYKFTGRAIEQHVDPITEANLNNRAGHGNKIYSDAQAVLQEHSEFLQLRELLGLPPVFDQHTVPLFLQVDPLDFDIESLKGFGIEIVSEEEDGFVIGANTDNLQSLANKIQQFVNEDGQSKNQAAKLWQIVQGSQWRENILSPSLKEKYIAGINDNDIFTVDISIACYLQFPECPVRVEAETDEKYAEAIARHKAKLQQGGSQKKMRRQRNAEAEAHYEVRLNRWRQRLEAAEMQRDDIASERQQYLTHFIQVIYGGQILSSFIDLQDSFSFSASLSGLALKDLIVGYAYVFDITESEQVDIEQTENELIASEDIEILTPHADAPKICVIDSGMQEAHVLLEPAILHSRSRNYVPYENTTSDQVADGGHGTKVAGAILYGSSIPASGIHQTPCFLINARILDADNSLPIRLYPAALMKQIVDEFTEARIFNLSVATRGNCRTGHMSSWAAMLDKLIHERSILFLLAIGNIRRTNNHPLRPGIEQHLQAGRTYPAYLLEPSSALANPSQSLLGLTVGSVCHGEFEDADRISFGRLNEVSSFSRSGPGLWGCIKPDVVEYGGDFLREKNGFLITLDSSTSAHVVKTGANRTGYDIGTSFATPKVGYIVALLASKFPHDSTLLYKALIVQSARLPENVFHRPTAMAMRHLGYGIPDINRALDNTPYRITFVAEGKVAAQQANLYSLTIPPELRTQGSNYDVLIEVTLTFTAMPRRTRQKLKSYFGSWLSWESSKLGESFELFSSRVLKNIDHSDDEAPDTNSIRWTISTSPNYGAVTGMKRQDSATQKDWTVLKSNVLTEELSFAIVGHKGWDTDTIQEIPFALVISLEAIAKEVEIYEKIEVANRVEVDTEIEIPIEESRR